MSKKKYLKSNTASLICLFVFLYFLILDLRSTCSHPLSWKEAEVLPPSNTKGKEPIKGTYVRVWEIVDPSIEWILFTFALIKTVEDALEVVRMYTERWVIEEYHKCLKTGCKLEEAQLKTGDRLLVLLGRVIATQLLQLGDISRSESEEPAKSMWR